MHMKGKKWILPAGVTLVAVIALAQLFKMNPSLPGADVVNRIL